MLTILFKIVAVVMFAAAALCLVYGVGLHIANNTKGGPVRYEWAVYTGCAVLAVLLGALSSYMWGLNL